MGPPPPPPPPPPQGPHGIEANGPYMTNAEKPSFIIFMNVVNTSTQLFLGAVALCGFFYANIYASITNIPIVGGVPSSLPNHIYLCVTGYVILMSQAILTINPHAGWAQTLKYPQKKTIHWIMQIFGSILAIAGSIIRIVDIDTNFQTPHGILGLIAMILAIISLIGGALNFILPNLMSTRFFKTCHTCLGCFTITIAFLCFGWGISDYNPSTDSNKNMSICVMFFAYVGIVMSVFSRVVRRIIDRI